MNFIRPKVVANDRQTKKNMNLIKFNSDKAVIDQKLPLLGEHIFGILKDIL